MKAFQLLCLRTFSKDAEGRVNEAGKREGRRGAGGTGGRGCSLQTSAGVILGAFGTVPARAPTVQSVTSSLFQSVLSRDFHSFLYQPLCPQLLEITSQATPCTEVLASDSAFGGPQPERGLKEGSWWRELQQRKSCCPAREVGDDTRVSTQ